MTDFVGVADYVKPRNVFNNGYISSSQQEPIEYDMTLQHNSYIIAVDRKSQSTMIWYCNTTAEITITIAVLVDDKSKPTVI